MPTPTFDGIVFDQNNQYDEDKKLMVQFFTEAVQNGHKSKEAGRPIFDEVDMVRIMTPGARDIMVQKASLQYQMRFPKQWEAYKTGKEQTVEGTPVEEVPFLSVGQIAELKAVNVRTLEQLASMSDVDAQKFMGHYALRDRAKNFLAAAKEAAPMLKLQAELEARDEKIAELQRQMGELMLLAQKQQQTVKA